MNPPDYWQGLPVTLDSANDPMSDTTGYRAVMRFDAYKRVGAISVSNQLLADSGIDVNAYITKALDKVVRPWLYPQVAPAWPVTLFPRWDRLVRWWLRTRVGWWLYDR